MKIARHKIDEEHAKRSFIYEMGELEAAIEGTKRNPKNLDLVERKAFEIIAYGCVAGGELAELRKAVQIGAQAHAAMLAVINASPSSPVTVPLGDRDLATYTSGADESTVHVGCWITGFYLNILSNDARGMDLMCSVSPDSLRQSSTKSPEYDYLYMEALQLFRAGKQESANKIIAALKATNPANAQVYDSDWSLFLVGHQLEVLMYVATQDKIEFGPALAKAVEYHKKYWSKTVSRRNDYKGYISLELTALAKLGQERGLPFDVESPYLAMNLINS